ncbi:hypothetical protein CMV_026690 [Castanea mollissima]|uniref:Uncharacterized protein n=1 Tax=Castanea mollissima TaxID=60419 RepID=A0A8J4QL92_9ROSI|nr:hypothetical protein CMV_026690 [Castanea mollissima]
MPDLLNLLQLLVNHQSKVGMARKGKRKGKGISESQDFQLQERAHQASNSIIIGTNAGKKKGRRKAKGINGGDDEIEAEIYDGKIITPKATQEITLLFHQKLNGAWKTFTEYPNSELETLYARYRAQRFKHKQPDEEDTSFTNKENIIKSKIFSITGFVPMAKYRYEMYLEMGSEPSPIDCFKKFHTKKNGKEWANDHAKTLYEKMDAIKAKAVSKEILCSSCSSCVLRVLRVFFVFEGLWWKFFGALEA